MACFERGETEKQVVRSSLPQSVVMDTREQRIVDTGKGGTTHQMLSYKVTI